MLPPAKDVPDRNCWNCSAWIRFSVSCGYWFARKSPRNMILKEKQSALISLLLLDVSSGLHSSISKQKHECCKAEQQNCHC